MVYNDPPVPDSPQDTPSLRKKDLFNWFWNARAGGVNGRYVYAGHMELWLYNELHKAMSDLGDTAQQIQRRLGKWVPITVKGDATGFHRGGGGWSAEAFAQHQRRSSTKDARSNLVLQPTASTSNLKDPKHFKLITSKEVIQYTLLGNVEKVFELTGIRTTATHLKRVHKEIADRIELKRILDMHITINLFRKSEFDRERGWQWVRQFKGIAL